MSSPSIMRARPDPPVSFTGLNHRHVPVLCGPVTRRENSIGVAIADMPQPAGVGPPTQSDIVKRLPVKKTGLQMKAGSLFP